MKYQYAKVTFQEIPDEITLCIAISGCKVHCKNCNQKNLWKNEGKDLNIQELDNLINANKGITCICFMGEGEELPMLLYYIKMIKKDSNLKTALYIGRDLNMTIKLYGNFFSCLDYLKVGSYISNLGGLDLKTTNQRLYNLKLVRTEGEFTDYETVFTDITYKLQK